MWFLPVIVIGGLFFPVLGYLVLGMMVFFLSLSYFKPRYWCWNLCPRGAFLDIKISEISSQKPLPKTFTKTPARILIFLTAGFLSFLLWKLIPKYNVFEGVGAVFVAIRFVTTIISIILGITTKPRSWCVICPMGRLQNAVGKLNPGKKK